jgi:hypothetical protein
LQLSKVRENANVFIEFDARRWLQDGNEAYLSANGVLNIFKPIDKEYFRLFLTSDYLHPEKPKEYRSKIQTVIDNLKLHSFTDEAAADIWSDPATRTT